MSKSTITREERIQAVFDLKVGYTLGLADIEILKRVARMALAAMDSESGCLPLDYLQGHKDGLEWASQLAEANHPDTGDWLYDDPIELAKAIRKGPDMPPAQPAPVVPDELKEAATDLLATLDDYPEQLVPINRKSSVVRALRAAMLQAGNSPEQNGDTPAQSQGWIPVSEQMPPSRHEVLVGRWWGEKPRWCCKWATYIPGHPDAQSSGWLIPGASWTPTHWMPLPAAPQEVGDA
ncbi:DUF551 domain-containing protein [Klebsiella pneumoniae]|uniref:DUF551 domain-containing protein n=1 Tax=Klebsiella pneumoniae TaxID=573 RepID=UPI000B734BBA|nr:DUF551 domain-containing protein [Klebsiella pneumoniae]OVX71843.1 hypothetical protein BME25_05065 [Klebsiella pneumoniae]